MSSLVLAADAARPASPSARRGSTHAATRGPGRRVSAASPQRAARASALPPSARPAPQPRPSLRAAVAAHLALALDAKARLALPQGDAPAVDVQPFSNLLWAFLGCFLSCAAFGIADAHLFQPMGVPFMMGSFGTISVLYFGAGLRAPVLRLWNVVVGHLAAASFAALALAFIQPLWLARATALAATVSFMLWTGAVHPPGGALVIILADSAKFQALGGWYVLWPGLAGALALYACAAATDELKRRFVFELSDVAAALRLRPAALPRPKVATA